MLDQNLTRASEKVGAVDTKSGALRLRSCLAVPALPFISRHVMIVSLSAHRMRMRRIIN